MNSRDRRSKTARPKYDFYISGPISSNLENYKEEFRMAEEHLRSVFGKRVRIFNPSLLEHDLGDNVDAESLWRYYMRACIPAVMSSEIVYMLVGWENSRGARLEKEIADIFNCVVIYQDHPVLGRVTHGV